MTVQIITGDCRQRLAEMEAQSVHCCVTSPPYFGLRDYDHDGQIGLEDTPDAFVAQTVDVFREVRRVLRDDGTLWLNLGDSYAGSWGAQSRRVTDSDDTSWHGSQIKNHPKRASGTGAIRQPGMKPKDLMGIPWMVAFALRADGWYLRQDIIWSKPNPMPESVTDRCTKAHEYVFLLSKGPRYYFDANAIAEPAGAKNEHDLTGPGYSAPGQAPHTGTRRAAGNKTHKGQTAYEGGEERFRTKAGLVSFAERERAKVQAGDLIGTRNKRSVWTVATQPFKEAHFATYPPDLIEPCILAGCPVGGTVLDPFGGAGTTGLVAERHGRDAVLIELNPKFASMAAERIRADNLGAGVFGVQRPEPDIGLDLFSRHPTVT